MVKKSKELEILTRAIADTEKRLDKTALTLLVSEQENEMFLELEQTLKENHKILKRDKIIASASEYKKVKADLQKVKAHLANTKTVLEDLKKDHGEQSKLLDRFKARHQELTKDSDNVIKGSFVGRKNG